MEKCIWIVSELLDLLDCKFSRKKINHELVESLFTSWIPCLFFSKWIILISFDIQEFSLISFILPERREKKRSKKKWKRKKKRKKKPNRMASQSKVFLWFTGVSKTLLISLSSPWVSVLLSQNSAQSIWDEPMLLLVSWVRQNSHCCAVYCWLSQVLMTTHLRANACGTEIVAIASSALLSTSSRMWVASYPFSYSLFSSFFASDSSVPLIRFSF